MVANRSEVRDWRCEGNASVSCMKQLARTILGPDRCNHMNAEPLGIFAIRLSVLTYTRWKGFNFLYANELL